MSVRLVGRGHVRMIARLSQGYGLGRMKLLLRLATVVNLSGGIIKCPHQR